MLHRPLLNCARAKELWHDLALQCRHSSCCRTPFQRQLLEQAAAKVSRNGGSYGNYWTIQAATKGYDALLSILACSSYAKREDLIRCGYHLSFMCHDRLLCPSCAQRLLVRPLRDEFANAFSADQELWFVVPSVSHQADERTRFVFRDRFASATQPPIHSSLATAISPQDYGLPFATLADVAACRTLFRLFSDSIRGCTGTAKTFSAVIGGPELSIRLKPLRVLPHANYLCWTKGFCESDARSLRQSIRKRMRDSRALPGGIYPAIGCYRLATAVDMLKVLAYAGKPLDLAQPYADAAAASSYDPAIMASINRDVNLFVANLPVLFDRLRRIERFGACHGAHRNYIGTVTAWRQRQRDVAAERRQLEREHQAPVRPSFVYEPDDAPPPGRMPRQSRLSSLDKWLTRIEHQWGTPRATGTRWRRWHEDYLHRTQAPAPPIP